MIVKLGVVLVPGPPAEPLLPGEDKVSSIGDTENTNPDHNTQYKSNTCRILSNKSPRDFYRFFSNMESCCAGPTLTPPRIWQMLKTTQSISPSSHLMTRMTNIILYLGLAAGLRLHNWVMQNKLYSQSQHYVPWWNVTPLTFKWLESLTDKMLLPLTGESWERCNTPLLNGPISKNRDQRSGILHIVRDP